LSKTNPTNQEYFHLGQESHFFHEKFTNDTKNPTLDENCQTLPKVPKHRRTIPKIAEYLKAGGGFY
jgi:hypothetical protein